MTKPGAPKIKANEQAWGSTPAPLSRPRGGTIGVRLADGALLVEAETMTAGVHRLQVSGTSKIERLYRRKSLSYAQTQAGVRFASIWRGATLPQSVTSSYGERRGGGGGSDTYVDSRRVLRLCLVGSGLGNPMELLPIRGIKPAYEAIGPYALTPEGMVVVDVAGEEHDVGGPARMRCLKAGLDRLVAYWRIPLFDDR